MVVAKRFRSTIGISITRLYLVVRGGWVNLDGSWYYNPQLAIQNAEMAATMIALSVPGLKPLFGSWFAHIRAPSSGRSHNVTPFGRSGKSGADGFASVGTSTNQQLYGLNVINPNSHHHHESPHGVGTRTNVIGAADSATTWENAESLSDGESTTGGVPAGAGGGDGRYGRGDMRAHGGIVVGRDFKVEVNGSDDSLLEAKSEVRRKYSMS